MQQLVKFPMTGGLDRSKASHLSSPGDFYDLMNFRPARNEEGAIEQTEYFKLYRNVTAGTGSISDSASSALQGLFPIQQNTVFGVGRNAYLISSGFSTQIPIFKQTVSVGSGFTLATGCMVRGDLNAAGVVTVGNALNIEVEVGAATFKYRINGGAYTTGVTIAVGGVAILSGAITVYFLTTTGFTTGWTWTWTRHDSFENASGGTSMRQPQFVANRNGSVYFIRADTSTEPSGHVYRLDALASTYIIYSAGYRPLYGCELCVFADHLFMVGTVFGFGPAIHTALSWSDRADFDNFLISDLNEADYRLFISPADNTTYKLVGLHATNSQLFVFTISEIFVTSYLGLPVVFNFVSFSFQPAITPPTSTGFECGVIQTVFSVDKYAFIFTQTGWLLFNGAQFINIGAPVAFAFPGTDLTTAIRYCYVFQWQEVVFLYGTRLYIYSIAKNRWHSRSVDFANGTPNCLAANFLGNSILASLANLQIVIEDVAWAAAPIKDYAVGVAYAKPTLTKHLYNAGSFSAVKDALGQTAISARVITVSSTYYSTDADAVLDAFERTIAPTAVELEMPGASLFVDYRWATNNTRYFLSSPKLPFRAMALELRGDGFVADKPAGQLVVYELESLIRGIPGVTK